MDKSLKVAYHRASFNSTSFKTLNCIRTKLPVSKVIISFIKLVHTNYVGLSFKEIFLNTFVFFNPFPSY